MLVANLHLCRSHNFHPLLNIMHKSTLT